MPPPPKFEDEYELGPEIGQGSFAIVYKCTHKVRGDIAAVKKIDKTKTAAKDVADLMLEVSVMKSIGEHPHVVRMLDAYDTADTMYIVMEFLEGGMLFDRIVALKHYSEGTASQLIKNLLGALQHIHAAGYMHRDLKPENLLLKRTTATSESDNTHQTDFVVADFGMAGKPPGQTCCGSPNYIAPEVIQVGYYRSQKEPYDTKCDLWAVGVIAFILLCGKMPFHGKNFKDTFAKVVKGHWAFVGEVWETSVSSAGKDFIKKMLTVDPKLRPSAAEALQHPWVATMQPDVHLAAPLEGIKQFNAERKLKSAMVMFRATTSFLGKVDRTPPFLKYLSHQNKLSTVIQAQSQTESAKTHYVDFAKALLRRQPGWRFKDCCTCGSSMVCRHVQNVHEYLFVGRREMDMEPYVNELFMMKQEIEIDCQDDPGNATNQARLEEINDVLTAAKVFQEEYMKVPPSQMKANYTLDAGKASPFAAVGAVGVIMNKRRDKAAHGH